MLAIYIVRETWRKYDLEIIDRVIDDWFLYYETGFVEYQDSFELISEDFDELVNISPTVPTVTGVSINEFPIF